MQQFLQPLIFYFDSFSMEYGLHSDPSGASRSLFTTKYLGLSRVLRFHNFSNIAMILQTSLPVHALAIMNCFENSYRLNDKIKFLVLCYLILLLVEKQKYVLDIL